VQRRRVNLPQERLVPLIVACGLFMENLDSTVLATALPAIAKSLDVNPLRLNLAITAYLFSLAVFIPVSGWVADKFGARDVFRAAIGVFVTGSVLCGLSSSIVALVPNEIQLGDSSPKMRDRRGTPRFPGDSVRSCRFGRRVLKILVLAVQSRPCPPFQSLTRHRALG